MKQYVLGNGLSRDLKFQYHIDIDTQIRKCVTPSVCATHMSVVCRLLVPWAPAYDVSFID